MTPSRERRLGAAGVWHYVTVDENGGGGSLPAGGSTGEVLTKESNADGDVGWEAGGGSQPGAVRLLDLETVTTRDCATLGPQTLYTPEAGERIYGVMLDDWIPSDQSAKTLLGALASMLAQNEDGALAFFDNDVFAAAYAPLTDDLQDAIASDNFFRFITDDLVAVWQTNFNNTLIVDSAAETWQGTHVYAEGTWLLDSNDHLQHCITGGTSGGSEPDWDDSGSTTMDGSVLWSDEGPAPTDGEVHVCAHVAAPAAP